jgi:aminoglycoside N3'-acetyltransferase
MSQKVAPAELTAQLKKLGLRRGDVVMTHASMRKVGKVEDGATGLIHALVDAVGSAGTILMALGADGDEAFDPKVTPVDIEDMGILAEVFRTYPGVCVSDHPADRFGALGPLARDILEPTPLHDYHGPGSPLERFVTFGGRVLRLGANPDTITLTHYAEYLAEIPNKIRVRRRYVRADSGEVWIESLDDNDGIVRWPHGDYFPQIYLDYRSSGAVCVSPVGRCEGELFDARHFVAFAVDWMNRSLAAAK